jgi:hypothetical protein
VSAAALQIHRPVPVNDLLGQDAASHPILAAARGTLRGKLHTWPSRLTSKMSSQPAPATRLRRN